ncbi:hypothetical protein BC830DRAFT_260966 [Chytriomyces sp. MP71]|nr:hypothetical protein BC830DRAFT_260966 [Chytriomyces sp. MP71]
MAERFLLQAEGLSLVGEPIDCAIAPSQAKLQPHDTECVRAIQTCIAIKIISPEAPAQLPLPKRPPPTLLGLEPHASRHPQHNSPSPPVHSQFPSSPPRHSNTPSPRAPYPQPHPLTEPPKADPTRPASCGHPASRLHNA